jgi:hypothetical protein
MRLYAGMSRNFIDDTVRNQIAGKLQDAFFRHFRFRPPPGEVSSWRNSLRAVAQVFQASDLLDHGVILEYQLPLTSKRLDCLICGRNGEDSDGAVIVELKQWDKCSPAARAAPPNRWLAGPWRSLQSASVYPSPSCSLFGTERHTGRSLPARPPTSPVLLTEATRGMSQKSS